MNGYGKLCRCTEHDGEVVALDLFLAAAFVTGRPSFREARQRLYRPVRVTVSVVGPA
jgi:hypothetical protein